MTHETHHREREASRSNFERSRLLRFLTRAIVSTMGSSMFLLLQALSAGAQPQYLRQSLSKAAAVNTEVSTKTARYQAVFGLGASDSELVKAVKHYGFLTIDPNGESKVVHYNREEVVYYVLAGTGMLRYGNGQMPISKNDFFYIPIGARHGFSNPREDTLTLMMVGVEIPANVAVKPTPHLPLANADKVSFQLLPQSNHGPSSRFQLLLGNTNSKRDRLAAASQINSLYVIDFDPGGTNIPHRHENEEEIYFMLRGAGEMVAGQTPEGKEARHPVKEGDAFFFARNTLVGFYSSTDTTKEHARILAVRVKHSQLSEASAEKK